MIKVGIWTPNLFLGGYSEWLNTLLKFTDKSIISYQGIAVLYGSGFSDKETEKTFPNDIPILYGMDKARELASSCDVIIIWGCTNCREILSGLVNEPKKIAVLHFTDEVGPMQTIYKEEDNIDSFVAVSPLTISTMPPVYKNSITIMNCIDEDRLISNMSRFALRQCWGLSEDVKILGYIGRLEQEKDPMAVARLMPYLPEGWHCVVIGDGSYQQQLYNTSVNFPRLHVFKSSRNIGGCFNAFDEIIIPSIYESFGLTIAEAISFGIPVISTKVGICKLQDGLTREIQINDIGDSIATALNLDIQNKDETQNRVAFAKGWANTNVSSSKFGNEWTQHIINVVNSTSN